MRVLVLVSLLLSLSIHAQTFEQATLIRLHEQQVSIRGAAMGGVSDDDPALNPASLGNVTRALFSLSASQVEPVDGNGLAHALAAVPLGSFVVAAHYRANPSVQGPDRVLPAGPAPHDEPACTPFGCGFYILSGDMFERRDRRYGLSAAWTHGNVSLGAGAELHELHESAAIGLTLVPDNSNRARDLVVSRLSGRELVPHAGIRVKVTPKVTVAAAYNGGAKFRHTIETCGLVDDDQPLRCATEYLQLVATKQGSPSAIRASVTVSPVAGITLTGEAVRRNHGETIDNDRPFFTDPYRDVTELHAGAEYRVSNVALRAGWWTDPVRYIGDFYSSFSPLGQRQNHFTFGAGVDVGRARLEVAFDDADEPSLRRAVVGVAFR